MLKTEGRRLLGRPVLCPRNIFNKLSFRVKREILVDLSGYKISPFSQDDNLIMGHNII